MKNKTLHNTLFILAGCSALGFFWAFMTSPEVNGNLRTQIIQNTDNCRLAGLSSGQQNQTGTHKVISTPNGCELVTITGISTVPSLIPTTPQISPPIQNSTPQTLQIGGQTTTLSTAPLKIGTTTLVPQIPQTATQGIKPTSPLLIAPQPSGSAIQINQTPTPSFPQTQLPGSIPNTIAPSGLTVSPTTILKAPDGRQFTIDFVSGKIIYK